MLGALITQFIKLVEVRENSRLLIARECLEPIWKAITELHSTYTNNFQEYLAKIEGGSASEEIASLLERDLLRIADLRFEVYIPFRTATLVTRTRTESGETQEKAFIAALEDYLSMSLDDKTLSPLLVRRNPGYVRLHEVAKSTKGTKQLRKVLVALISALNRRYDILGITYSDYRTALLKG